MADGLIVVVGAPRSGTSITCHVLQALGVDFGGPLVGTAKSNPHGFMEHRTVREEVTKPTLLGMGFDPRGQGPLPPRSWEPLEDEIEPFRRLMLTALEGAEAVKDPKLLLLWPLVDAAFPEARWIFVRRESRHVVESMYRVRWMRLGSLRATRMYVREIEGRMELAGPQVGAVEVWPDPSDKESFLGMAEALGLEWDDGAVRGVLDPGIWSGP